MKTKSTQSQGYRRPYHSAFTFIELCLVLTLVAFIGAIAWSHNHREKVLMPAAFEVWVKQTGNESQLTYAEWRTLMRASENQTTSPVIIIPGRTSR